MKPRTKAIVAGCSAAVVLGGVVTALMLTAPEKEEEEVQETTAPQKESKLLYDKNPDDIVSVDLKKPDGTLKLVKYAEGQWTVEGMEKYPLSRSALESTVNSCASLTALQTVNEAPDDLSIYGLAEPQVTADIHFSGSEMIIAVGSEIPSGGEYYITLNGEKTVYTADDDAVIPLLSEDTDFIHKLIYGVPADTDPDDGIEASRINAITVSRPDIDYDIRVEYDPRQDDPDIITGNSSTHIMTEPVTLNLNPDASKDFLEKIYSITASGVAALSPDEKQLEEFGLKEPAATVDFDIVAGELILDIGNAIKDEDGNLTGYYGLVHDFENVVYTFNKEDVPWVTVMPLDITVSMIATNYIYSVDSLDIETDGVNRHFDLSGDKDDFSVKLDGKPYEDTDLFKSFYQFILRAPAEELYITDTDTPPRITIKVNSKALGDDVIEFIPDKDRMTAVRLNGRMSFRCRTTYVDRLIQNLKSMETGGEVIGNW